MERNIWDLLSRFRNRVIISILLLSFCGNIVVSVKFQTSNLNAGRARLILYQGKTRHEVIGRTCPVGLAFRSPQLFSCACVTGVWAFYDIMCAAPLQIIGGVDHCFRMPLDTYFQQAILVSNPTRSHGDSLTAFEGDMESIHNKFFRETHSRLQTPDRMLAVGPTWTLKSPSGAKEVCLDSTKNTIFEDHDGNGDVLSYTSAYCQYGNESKVYIKDIGAVRPGCKDNARRIEPEYCYPFLESNSEEICTDLEVLEAYELAVEEENNDLASQNKTREFKRLVKKKKSIPKTTTTTTTTTTPKPKLKPRERKKLKDMTSSTKKIGDKKQIIQQERLNKMSREPYTYTRTLQSPSAFPSSPIIRASADDMPAVSSLNNNDVETATDVSSSFNSMESPAQASEYETKVSKASVESPSSVSAITEDYGEENEEGKKKGMNINPVLDNQFNEGDDIDDPVQRLHRNTGLDDGKDPTVLDEAEMMRIYEETVKNQENFLILSGSDSNKIVLRHVWEYQQDQIKRALKLKTDSKPEAPKLQIRGILEKIVEVSTKTCLAVPEGFLTLAMDTFINIQDKEYRWHPPFFTDRELQGIQLALDKCSLEAMPFGFVKNQGSACVRRNADEIFLGGQKEKIEVPDHISSDGFEPLIEALWKVSVHAIVYCDPYLNPDFVSSSKFHMSLMEIFRNKIHLIWFQNKVLDVEYGGILGDTKVILKDLDLCLVAAKKETKIAVEYQRPEFVAPPGWIPPQEESSPSSTFTTTTEAPETNIKTDTRRQIEVETDFQNSNSLLLPKFESAGKEQTTNVEDGLVGESDSYIEDFILGPDKLLSDSDAAKLVATKSPLPVAQLQTTTLTNPTLLKTHQPSADNLMLTTLPMNFDSPDHNDIPKTTARTTIQATNSPITTEAKTRSATISPVIEATSSPLTATFSTHTSSSPLLDSVTNVNSITASPSTISSIGSQLQKGLPNETTTIFPTTISPTKVTTAIPLTVLASASTTAAPNLAQIPSTTSMKIQSLVTPSTAANGTTTTITPEKSGIMSANTTTSSPATTPIASKPLNTTTKMADTTSKTNRRRRRKRRAIHGDKSLIVDAEENWKRQRSILGMAYCLKKFDDPIRHLGQNCEE